MLAHDVAAWVAAAAREQIERLAALGLDVLLIVDEPGLAAAGLAGADVGIWHALQAAGAAAWGLHVCGAVPWGVIDAGDPDVLSFDVTRAELEPRGRRALRRLLTRGGRIAWGVVDTAGDFDEHEPVAVAAAALTAPGLPPAAVAARSLLTPACGTGRLPDQRERRVASAVETAADETRAALRTLSVTARPEVSSR